MVHRTPLTALRDFTPRRPADVIPTLVLPPQAGHDSCIVDFSEHQSQMRTIRAAGLERLFALEWIGATQATKDATIDDVLADVDDAVARAGGGGPVNLVGDCQGGWLAAIYAALEPERVNTLTIAGAPIDFHAGDAVIHESTQALSGSRPVVLPRARRDGRRRAEGRAAARRLHRYPPRQRARPPAPAPGPHPRAGARRALPRLRGLVQVHPGPRRAVLPLARRAPLPRQPPARGHARAGGPARRPEPDHVPRQHAGRRGRPHHAARAGLRPRRRGLDPARGHRPAHGVGRAPGLFMGTEALRDHWPVVMASVLEHSAARTKPAAARRRARARTPAARPLPAA